MTVLAVAAFRGGRGWLQLREHAAEWRVAGPGRLSGYGSLPAADAALAFEEHHPRCFEAAAEWGLRRASFDERRYEACLDDVAARHWSDRVALSGGATLEQDPHFPGSWRTRISVSGEVPPGFTLRYEPRRDGEPLRGMSSNVFDRSSGAGSSLEPELVIPKLLARRCAGDATLEVSASMGEWLLGPPLVVRLPREEVPSREATPP